MFGPDFYLNPSEQWFHFSEQILEALAKFWEWVKKLISSPVISASLLWGNVLLEGELQIKARKSKFEIFESVFYMQSGRIPNN